MVSNIQDTVTTYISQQSIDINTKTAPSLVLPADEEAGKTKDAGNSINEKPDETSEQNKADKNRNTVLEKKKLTKKDVNTMTSALNDFMKNLNCDLEFKYYDKLNQLTVRMVDSKTHETIKEFPPEEIMKAMIRTKEWLGVFLDKNA